MWLNNDRTTHSHIALYRQSLSNNTPRHVIIDNLFNETKLNEVLRALQQSCHWETQKHTYAELYVGTEEWEKTSREQRFVKRDVWLRKLDNVETSQPKVYHSAIANDFLKFLRDDTFLTFLSKIFNVVLTDKNVANPEINTNYFRLNSSDFVEQHADDSPGREVCMLLYLNKNWHHDAKGNLVFLANNDPTVSISPIFNRCVLFNPSSNGSEHWVEKLSIKAANTYRYNITSWYWSE